MPPNFVNFGPQTTENGWRVFAHLLYFRIKRHCQPYRMAVINNRQHANAVENNRMPGELTQGFAMHLVNFFCPVTKIGSEVAVRPSVCTLPLAQKRCVLSYDFYRTIESSRLQIELTSQCGRIGTRNSQNVTEAKK